jgi:HK97 family phage major capsid protein
MEKTKEYEELKSQLVADMKSVTDSAIKEAAEKAVEANEKARKEADKTERKFTSNAGKTDSPVTDFAKAWKSGKMLQAIWAKEHGRTDIDTTVLKALGESAGATGGFMLYDQFLPEVQKLIIEDQIVRKYARTIPMAMETILVPRIVDTTHASSIHGGVKGTYTAEAGDISSTSGDPAFGQVRLIAKKFDNLIKVSNELLMDSPISVVPLVEQLMREGIGFFEDADFFNGNGAGKPIGVLNAANAALVSTTRTTTSHIVFDDAVNMWCRLFPSSQKRAVWVISPAAFADVAKFAVVVGVGGSAVFISNVPGQTMADAPPMTLFGRPVLVSEKVPNLGTKGDIGLYDFSYYLIGDRMQLTMTTSDQRYFETDQTAFKVVERLDGQPWLSSALTPYNSGDTLSAFVVVAT